MRSIFIPQKDFSINDNSLTLNDSNQVNHLVKVLRVKLNDQIIIFNEVGEYVDAKVEGIEKRQVEFKLSKPQVYVKKHEIELGVAWLKKDAMEEAVTSAIQLGITKINVFKSERSQSLQDLTKERWERIIISAMEQSNNYMWPKIKIFESLDELIISSKNLDEVYGFSLMTTELKKNQNIDNGIVKLSTKSLYLVGPEGGFTVNEFNNLSVNGVKFFQIDTAILRAPVAVSCAMGYILAQV